MHSRYGATFQYCGDYALPLGGPATHTAAGPTNMAYRPTTLYTIAQIISTRNYGHFHRNLSVPKLIFNAKGKRRRASPDHMSGTDTQITKRRARSAQPALELTHCCYIQNNDSRLTKRPEERCSNFVVLRYSMRHLPGISI